MAEEIAGPEKQRWQVQAFDRGPEGGRGDRRGTWIVLLFAMFLALASILAIWLLLIKPPPPPPFLLTIHIGDFNSGHYPVLAFTGQDGERLQSHFPSKKQAETKTKELLRRELAGLATRTEPILVQISALALTRNETVFLLPGDADPDDESTWLDVAEILESIGHCPARHKLLILDLAHPLTNPRLGVLSDRVAETLERNLTKSPPAFFVLCPCSAGEYSLNSEGIRASAMAYYVDQGLQGAADLDKDWRITVRELFGFVEMRVDQWAQINRGTRQKPRLHGKADDFVVSSITKNALSPAGRPTLEPYPTILYEGWKQRDIVREKAAFRKSPRQLMKLDAILLRHENLWRGGVLAKKDLATFDDEVAPLIRTLTQSVSSPPMPVRSLAQARVKPSPEIVETVLNIVAAAKDRGGKKDIQAKLAQELTKKLQESKDSSFPQQAVVVMEALSRAAQLQPEHLRLAHEVVAGLNPRQRYVEVLYLRRLSDFAERIQIRNPDTWSPQHAQALLQCLRLRESVVAALAEEPRFLPWVAPMIEEADPQRLQGEKKLLWERPSSWPSAHDSLRTASEKYKLASQTIDALHRGDASLTRAFAELSAYSNLICDWPEFDAQAESAWSSAAREALVLRKLFTAPVNAVNLGAIDEQGRNLDRHFLELRTMLDRRLAEIKKGDKGKVVSQANCLLACPILTAAERHAVFVRHREVMAALQDQTDKLDLENTRHAGSQDASKREENRETVRARMSVALLELGGLAAEVKLAVPSGVPSGRDLTRLEQGIHDLWAKDLVRQWQTAKDPVLADSLERTVSPWEVDRRPSSDRNPVRVIQKKQRDAFFAWQESRYQMEARALEADGHDPLAASFYTEAARELRLHVPE